MWPKGLLSQCEPQSAVKSIWLSDFLIRGQIKRCLCQRKFNRITGKVMLERGERTREGKYS